MTNEVVCLKSGLWGLGRCKAPLAVAFALLALSACDDDGAGVMNADGAVVGGGGGATATGGTGGPFGTDANAMGGQGQGLDGGAEPDAAPAFMPEVGNVIMKPATLPITIDFDVPADLTGSFKVSAVQAGAVTHDAQEGGRVKVLTGQEALIFYDTSPDETGSDAFDEFTASITFKSTGLPRLGFYFGGDDKRGQGRLATVHFSNAVVGPPGVGDVNAFNYSEACSPQYWAVPDAQTCATHLAGAYAFNGARPDNTPFTFEMTVKKAGAAALQIYTAYYQGSTLIDHQVYTTGAVARLTGELGISAVAIAGDLFIDDFKVQAAKAIPDFKVASFADANTTWFLWVPEGLTTVNGIFHFYPTMMMPAGKTGEFAMWDHYRRFAEAHGFALFSHYGGADTEAGTVASADAALMALATQTGHPELPTAPIFVEGLVDRFPLAYAKAHPTKTIGFVLNKPAAETADNVLPDALTYQVPGLFTYAPESGLSGLGGTGPMVTAGRAAGALWAMAANGGQTHAEVDSYVLYLSFLERLIALRMTPGSFVLKPLDKAMGWLGEHKPALTEEFALVRPYGVADDASMSWLPDQAFALVYSSYHYNAITAGKFAPKKVFFVAAPLHGKAGESRTVRVGFAPAFTWKTIEFFDNGEKRGELVYAPNVVPEFTFAALTKGSHAFVARVTDAADKVHLAHPVMAVFSP